MKLRHIEIFHAVFVSGSVSGAAKSLNVSQPTVSKVLKHAESLLGFELFHREHGRIFPTEKGKLLFEQTLPVFEQISELRKYAAMLASSRVGQLRLAVTPAFSLEVMPKVLSRFSKSHRDVSIEIETLHAPEIMRAVANNAIDMGLAIEAAQKPGLSLTSIGQTRFVCAAPKAYNLSPGDISLAELGKHPIIHLNAKSPLGLMLNNKFVEAMGQSPTGQITAETYHLAKRLAAQGAGVAIVDNVTALSGQRHGLSIHPVSDLNSISIDLITRTQEPVVGYRAVFLAQLRAELTKFA